jgi:hypothetical protein
MKNKFIVKNKIVLFIVTLLLTVVVTRVLTHYKDLDIILFGYELHHFYYGVALLIIINLAILFGKHYPRFYLYGSAVAIGLIADEFSFVMKGLRNAEYSSTVTHSIFVTLVVIAVLVVIALQIVDRVKARRS